MIQIKPGSQINNIKPGSQINNIKPGSPINNISSVQKEPETKK